MKVKGVIDSLNFSSNHLEDYFESDDYIIEPIKGIGVFKPNRWLEVYNKPLTRNIIEAKLLHTSMGLVLPIKRYSTKKDKQVLEFAGLNRYDEISIYKRELLHSLMGLIQDDIINRIDIAIDFKKIPERVLRELKKNRQPFKWVNSTYYKTESETKKNYHINILIYPKHKKDNLDYDVERLEFSFGGAYLRGKHPIRDIHSLEQRIVKTIRRFTGLKVEIQPL